MSTNKPSILTYEDVVKAKEVLDRAEVPTPYTTEVANSYIVMDDLAPGTVTYTTGTADTWYVPPVPREEPVVPEGVTVVDEPELKITLQVIADRIEVRVSIEDYRIIGYVDSSVLNKQMSHMPILHTKLPISIAYTTPEEDDG